MGFHTPDKPVQTQDATDKWIPGINPYAAELFRIIVRRLGLKLRQQFQLQMTNNDYIYKNKINVHKNY